MNTTELQQHKTRAQALGVVMSNAKRFEMVEAALSGIVPTERSEYAMYCNALYKRRAWGELAYVVDGLLPKFPHDVGLLSCGSEAFARLLRLDRAFDLLARLMARAPSLHPDIREWCGDVELQGRSITVVFSVGGFGDDIMMARFIPLLAAQGAKVTIQVRRPIADLLRTVPGVSDVIDIEGRAATDLVVDVRRLPWLLGITAATLPNGPYLRKDQPPPALDGEGYRIGIAWGLDGSSSAERAVPLAALHPLSRIEGVTLHSLERGPYAAQQFPPPAGMHIQDLGTHFKDFTETAAAIAAMDLIVTSDCVIANLAGALGRPFMVLLPYICDGRWAPGPRSIWYPTGEQFAQAEEWDWRGPVAAMVEAVKQRMAGNLDRREKGGA